MFMHILSHWKSCVASAVVGSNCMYLLSAIQSVCDYTLNHRQKIFKNNAFSEDSR